MLGNASNLRALDALALSSLLLAHPPLAQAQTTSSANAQAENPPLAKLPPLLPRHRIGYDNLAILRLNPEGLESRLLVGYRLRLYDDPGPLWRDASFGFMLFPTIAPAVGRIGALVEVKPIAIFSMSAAAHYTSFFGVLNHVQSYPSLTADHSDSALDRGNELGQDYAASGLEGILKAKLLGKVGPIVFQNEASFYGGQFNLRPGDQFYYSVYTDMLVSNGGWSMTNDTDLVYLTDFGFVAGVRTTLIHAFYQPGENKDDIAGLITPTVRAGPIAAYTLFDHPSEVISKPTIILIANWWLRHRYRTGQDVSQALPYMILALKLEGDFWTKQ